MAYRPTHYSLTELSMYTSHVSLLFKYIYLCISYRWLLGFSLNVKSISVLLCWNGSWETAKWPWVDSRSSGVTPRELTHDVLSFHFLIHEMGLFRPNRDSFTNCEMLPQEITAVGIALAIRHLAPPEMCSLLVVHWVSINRLLCRTREAGRRWKRETGAWVEWKLKLGADEGKLADGASGYSKTLLHHLAVNVISCAWVEGDFST